MTFPERDTATNASRTRVSGIDRIFSPVFRIYPRSGFRSRRIYATLRHWTSLTVHRACRLFRLSAHRKWREGAFTEREFREVSAQFFDDCAAGLWTWFSVTDSLIANAAESIRTLSKRVTIRSADALHLVCARENGLRRLYTNDHHMLRAAPAFGVEVRTI